MPLPGTTTWHGTWGVSWDHAWERNAGEAEEINRREIRRANGWHTSVPLRADVPSQFVKG